MKTILLTLAAITAQAQTATIAFTGAPAKPGASVTVTITLAGAATDSTGPAALQFKAPIPSGAIASSIIAGKSLQCSNGGCILIGGQNLIANGNIGTLTFPAPSTSVPMPITAPLAVNALSDPVVITAGPLFTLPVISPCDLNSDGKTDAADSKLIIDAIVNAMTPGGPLAPGVYDLNADGAVTVLDAQRVVNAAAGQACRTGA